jgi:hypothetical protein
MNNNPVNYIDPYGLLGLSDFNPALLFNGQAWSQLGSDIFMGNTSQAVDPNSYQALMQNNGTPLLSPLTDQNGNQLGNPASAVGGAVVGGIADAASLMAGGGEAKGAIKCEKAAANWLWPQGKGVAKMLRQMEQRGWTPQQITEAIEKGQQFAAQNLVNPGNPAIRYVNPTTGQSVVVDTVTHEVIHVGGPGFKY